MKIDFKKIFYKYFLLAFILEIITLLYNYNSLTKFNLAYIVLYFFFVLGVFVFWALLDYFQHVTGILMAETWVSRIIFIIVALGLFYIYRINGRI
ncbi:hypothetical protein H3N56_10985 [Cetobacterium sp. 2A]|uniref:hypothetical protein n=1 Tax=Cetobacterium sp. 2A TaxID=2754723 RepID=UPI00163BD5B4|nr:hypothetical protein [Cetobacterium sp. 2A]MBC2856958.1 hypothetical protein [Cetobacterium sp. 2A]